MESVRGFSLPMRGASAAPVRSDRLIPEVRAPVDRLFTEGFFNWSLLISVSDPD
jgi:hypothetical protein